MSIFTATHLLGKIEPQGDIPPMKAVLARAMHVAWPAMVESFMVSVVGMVDTIMVGALGSAAIAAVGLTSQPKFLALAVFMSLNVAVSAVIARRVGERDRLDANRILCFAVALTVLLTVLITMVFAGFARPIVFMMGGEQHTLELATEYFLVIILGLGFTTISLVINAAQRGAGNTKIAMRTNLVSNSINVVFNYLLIEGNLGFPALGVRGAALATVLGSVFACGMSIASVSKQGGLLYLWDIENIAVSKKSLVALWGIGSSSLFEQLFQRFGFLLYIMTVASLGTAAMAAHQIGMNICMLSFSLGEGLSYAAVALVGRSMGEKRIDLAKLYGETCQRVGLVCSALISVVFLLGGVRLFALFCRNDPEVMVYAWPISLMLCLVTFIQIAAVVYAGCLRGAGDSVYIAIVSLICMAILRPLGSWILCYPLGLGLIGAWVGFLLDVLIRWVLTCWRFQGGKWTSIRV